jgi:hypothetical protein
MVHYPPSEADSNSPDEEILPLLWISKVSFFRSEGPTDGSYLTQNIPSRYKIVLPTTPYSPSGLQTA